MTTLTTNYRPTMFSDMVGQQHIIGQNGILTRMLQTNNIQSCIFYGPPGTGKTTAAMILANQCNMPFQTFNATSASLTDVRKAIDKAPEPFLLYMDEIQYFNKKQQQSLLPYIESGKIILIAATTDNPYYCCYDALLSRCHIIEFKPVSIDDIDAKLHQLTTFENRQITDDAIRTIAENAAGDVRRAIHQLELNFMQYDTSHEITNDDVKTIMPTTRMSGFDTDGDTHYTLISGLQKSIRGSDPNAAIFYLARLLEGGDLLSTCETTYNRAVEDIKNGKGKVIPNYLRHACSKGYKYPHDYPNHWCPQQYLPDDLVGRIYYEPQQNQFEQQAANYWSYIMTQANKS